MPRVLRRALFLLCAWETEAQGGGFCSYPMQAPTLRWGRRGTWCLRLWGQWEGHTEEAMGERWAWHRLAGAGHWAVELTFMLTSLREP